MHAQGHCENGDHGRLWEVLVGFELTPQQLQFNRDGKRFRIDAAAPQASPTPATPSAQVHTIASLARLPASEIIRLVNSSSVTGLPLPKADPMVVKATDEFIDSLQDKPVNQQKQQLGDKLYVVLLVKLSGVGLTFVFRWRVVKAFGIKGAVSILSELSMVCY